MNRADGLSADDLMRKMLIMTEQYLIQQTAKSTGHLTDIFTNTDSVSQDRTFNPYVTCIQININQSDKQEDRIPDL